MTTFFNRQVQVVIDAGRGSLIELNPELSVSFSVRKNRSQTPNEFDLDIANLAPTSKQALKQANAKVLLKAGYEPDAGVLAVGTVVRSATSWLDADSVTKVQLLDGVLTLDNTNVSLYLPPNTSVAQAVEVIAGQMGIQFSIGNSVAVNNRFTTGYSYVGKVAKALSEVARRGGARWSIQNGVLVVAGAADKTTPVLELTANSGLLARPEEIESTVVSDRVIKGRLPVRGYQLTCLLLPSLNPHNYVRVKSRELDATLVVDEVFHEGGNRQDTMTTRLTVYEQ